MTDGTLLGFGCAVSFIVVAGAYVYVRERFTEAQRADRVRVERVRRLRKVA